MRNAIVKITSVSNLRARLDSLRKEGKKIGFLPTMGALHEGHLSLARRLKSDCDVRVCSIFVNPTQFNDPKDYEAYTINLEQDEALLAKEGVDILFAPTLNEIYPNNSQTSVTLSKVTQRYEGEHRPGHFAGVATVVAILFNCVRPDVTIFGEKDFQQLRLIEQMNDDLKFGIKIIRGELVRDSDGLALSSRNVRLSPEGRKHALAISRGLFNARTLFVEGERSSAVLEKAVYDEVKLIPNHQVDYIKVAEELTLEPVEKINSAARLLVVVRVEGIRLLDNMALHP